MPITISPTIPTININGHSYAHADFENNLPGTLGALGRDLSSTIAALELVGTLAKAITGNTTLTAGESANLGFVFTGTLSGNATVTFAAGFEGPAFVFNSTSGGFSVICTLGGDTVTIPNGERVLIFSDGTDFSFMSGRFADLSTAGNGTVGGTLAVTGATTLSSTLAATGNATIGGTLGVTGATGLGVLTVSAGASFLANVTIATTLNVTGNVGFAGALTVTGLLSAASLGVSGGATFDSGIVAGTTLFLGSDTDEATVTFDTNDGFIFDKSTNTLNLYIGGVLKETWS